MPTHPIPTSPDEAAEAVEATRTGGTFAGKYLADGAPDHDPDDPHQLAAAILRQLADDIVTHRLPLRRHGTEVNFVLDTRAELEEWATYLGVKVSNSGEIPHATRYAAEVRVSAQSPRESEVDRLKAELAATQQRLSEALTTANAGQVEQPPQDGHQYLCCGKVGRISPHAAWCPGVTR